MVEQVRRFNRTVTERVGALNDHFLGTDRPLGEARLLWEIGLEGCEVRLLRARLGLDSGYVSRLLRSLQADLKALSAVNGELAKAVATLAANIGDLDPTAIVAELKASIESVTIHLDADGA